jgi:hypothetical protein
MDIVEHVDRRSHCPVTQPHVTPPRAIAGRRVRAVIPPGTSAASSSSPVRAKEDRRGASARSFPESERVINCSIGYPRIAILPGEYR